MRTVHVFFLITIALFSCSTSRMEKTVVGHWVIQSIEYQGKQITFGQGVLFLNIMNFNADGTCEMPGWTKSKTIEEKGNWSIERINDDYFLKIKNCTTNIYNDKFRLSLNQTFPKRITLTSDSLKLFCGEVQ